MLSDRIFFRCHLFLLAFGLPVPRRVLRRSFRYQIRLIFEQFVCVMESTTWEPEVPASAVAERLIQESKEQTS